MKTFTLVLTTLLLASAGVLPSFAQGTAFNYQGQLDVSNSPANGNYQLQFTLYANSTGNSLIAGPVTNSAVGVTNGIFNTTVNFGTGAFTGVTNWLDIAVRTNLPAAFTELTPRQQILPVPYAIYAAGASNAVFATSALTANTATTATTANSVAAGAINGSSIAAGTITLADLVPGEIVTNLNGLSGAITLAAANNLSLTTSGNTVTIGTGGDFLYCYLIVSNVAESVQTTFPVPISYGFFTGWQFASTYGNADPVFIVPDTGYYLIHIDGSTSSSTVNPAIGAMYGTTANDATLIPGSGAYESGTEFSHSFLAQLNAGYYLYFANIGTTTLKFGTVSETGGGIVYSITITRIY